MGAIGRNELCPCGSTKKYKKCCYWKDEGSRFTAYMTKHLLRDEDVHMEAFHNHFPEISEKENRCFWRLNKKPYEDEPYAFIESYCMRPECDCNRVVLGVVDMDKPNQTILSVGFAFDRNDDHPGPYIDPLNPLTKTGKELFPMVEDLLLNDVAWVARLQRHYNLMKEKSRSKKAINGSKNDGTIGTRRSPCHLKNTQKPNTTSSLVQDT